MLQAFQNLAGRHRDRIFTFACYCLGNREEAEDVTQEVLLRLWHNWQRVEEERVVAWLIHVTRNACIDAIRKRKTYRSFVAQDPEGEVTAIARSAEPGPGAAVEAADFRRHLERALREIAEPYRSIVILREVQDFKYEEISEALDMPLNTVKVYLHRGRRMLREQLRAYASEMGR
jgi:RNA polymerase sigma-70 factor (ECF subfamily)